MVLTGPSVHCSDFLGTGEDQMAPMSQYYDLPWLSWRALAYEKVERAEPGWLMGELMDADERHPADRGHACALEPLTQIPE